MIMKKKSSLKTPRDAHQRTDSIGAESTADSSRAEKNVTLIPSGEEMTIVDEKDSSNFSADPVFQVFFTPKCFLGNQKI